MVEELSKDTTYDGVGFTYEPYQAGSLMRQTTKTLPGGNGYSYQYYGAAEVRSNPCITSGANPSVSQAGMAKGKTEPDPDNNPATTNLPGINAPRTTETVYDAAGRVVASKLNGDGWTCVSYDARGRVTSTTIPTINGRAGYTLTNDYAVGGNPLVTAQTHSVTGTTTVTRDLLGRTTATTDTFGYQSTVAYDDFGRVSQSTSPKGTEVPTYDSYDRVTGYALDGTTYATVTYDQYSRLATVEYTQAQSGGNKLRLTQVNRDPMQRVIGGTYAFSDNSTFAESVTLNQQRGFVTGYSDTYGGHTAGATYSYDKLGRLTQATVDTMRYQYGYTTQAPSCTSATGNNVGSSKNGNRADYTITNLQTSASATTSSCYNYADQLISSSDTQLGTPTYDDHGNTVQLSGNGTPLTLTYNASDQNTAITQGGNKVEYSKSVSGAVLEKREYRNNTLDKIYRYAAGVLISCDVGNQSNCTVADKYLSLPGGVQLTIKGSGNVYSVRNFHGDTVLTVNATGMPTSSVYLYDPFGQTSPSSTFGTSGYSGSPKDPSNSTNQAMAWAASPSRKAEASDLFSIPIIQMGARVYLPTIGRFLQVDPIEGGTANAYVYALDPVNESDYSGLCILQCTASGSWLQPAATVTQGQLVVFAASNTRVSTSAKRKTTISRKSAGSSSSGLVLGLVPLSGDAARGVQYQSSVYGRQLQQGSSVAGRNLPSVSRLAKNPAIRVAGRYGGPVGVGMDFAGNYLEGDNLGRNALKTGLGAGLGAGGAALGGAACGAVSFGTGGLASATCPALIGGGGLIGSWVGTKFGEGVADVLGW